jgi:hypothetical protein
MEIFINTANQFDVMVCAEFYLSSIQCYFINRPFSVLFCAVFFEFITILIRIEIVIGQESQILPAFIVTLEKESCRLESDKWDRELPKSTPMLLSSNSHHKDGNVRLDELSNNNYNNYNGLEDSKVSLSQGVYSEVI